MNRTTVIAKSHSVNVWQDALRCVAHRFLLTACAALGLCAPVLAQTPTGGDLNTEVFAFPQDQKTRAVAIGDLNHDGYPDLVYGNEPVYDSTGTIVVKTGQDWVHLNDPATGRFAAPGMVTIPLGSGEYRTIAAAIADCNADTHPDIVMARSGQLLTIYLNDGMNPPSFTEVAFGDSGRATSSLALADFDTDGDVDIFEGVRKTDGSQRSQLYTNTFDSGAGYVAGGQPVFGAGRRIYSGSSDGDKGYAERVVAADANLDGTPDLIVANSAMGIPAALRLPNHVYLIYPGSMNHGATFLGKRRDLGDKDWNSYGAAAGDLNGDGNPDVAFATGSINSRAYLSNGRVGDLSWLSPYLDFPGEIDLSHDIATSTYYSSNQYCRSIVADFNGDCALDVVQARGVGDAGTLTLAVNDGSPNPVFSFSEFGPVVSGTLYDAAAADFDADGRLDVALARSGANFVCFNSDPGTTPAGTSIHEASCAASLPISSDYGKVWELEVTDGWDGLPTQITALTFNFHRPAPLPGQPVHSANKLEWRLRVLSGGGTFGASVVTEDAITFEAATGSSLLSISEGAWRSFVLEARSPSVATDCDGMTIPLSLSKSNIVTGINSTPIATAYLANSTDTLIDIVATRLVVIGGMPWPGNPVTTGSTLPYIEVAYVDNIGNTDRDVNGDVVTVTRSDGGAALQLVVTSVSHGIGNVQVTLGAPAATGVKLVFADDAGGSVNIGGGFESSPFDLIDPPATTPAITTITPDVGPQTGLSGVVITGSNFDMVEKVLFGGTSALITARTATQLTVNAPAWPGLPGPVDVVLTDAGITWAVTAAGAFTYDATSPNSPSLLVVAPDLGPLAGGISIFMLGSGFLQTAAAPSITFGAGNMAANVVVTSDSELTCTLPAGLVAGPVDVVVTTAGGSATLPGGFRYEVGPAGALPIVTALSPDTGPAAGGTFVSITGSGFTGATAVTFGAVMLGAADLVVRNDSQIDLITPVATAAGAVTVSVTTPAGVSVQTGTFSYTDPAILPPPPAPSPNSLQSGASGCAFSTGGESRWTLACVLLAAALALGAARRMRAVPRTRS